MYFQIITTQLHNTCLFHMSNKLIERMVHVFTYICRQTEYPSAHIVVILLGAFIVEALHKAVTTLIETENGIMAIAFVLPPAKCHLL